MFVVQREQPDIKLIWEAGRKDLKVLSIYGVEDLLRSSRIALVKGRPQFFGVRHLS